MPILCCLKLLTTVHLVPSLPLQTDNTSCRVPFYLASFRFIHTILTLLPYPKWRAGVAGTVLGALRLGHILSFSQL
jgi:hypothetical protein